MTIGTLLIVKPGLLTTIQDLGRVGYQALGVPVSGPMDAFSHRLANALVGNDETAATLEATLIGPEIGVDADTVMAVAGADFELWCDGAAVPTGVSFPVMRGQRLRFGRLRQGARAYLAVAGGILVPATLGSRATHLVSGMGGLEGRALRTADRLPIATGVAAGPSRRSPGLTLPTSGRALLRVLPGPQAEWFEADALRLFANATFRVSPRSDRMGYRLEGPPLVRAHEGELISEPVGMGAIQVPAAGEPILLMADRQTSGGYPKVAHVITADLPVAGQLAPGGFIDFAWCTRAEAIAALIARERELLRLSRFVGAG